MACETSEVSAAVLYLPHLVAFAAIGKDSLCFQRTESGLDTSPDPGLIYIVNGMRLAAAVDALVISRTRSSGDRVTGVAFAILVALTVCQSVVRIS